MTAPPKQFADRWRLNRAGIVNVWHYLENTFDLSGGRMILRGTNGSGKSRALEMLLPFLLDADRRKMDATGSARVTLDELMRTGAREQSNRSGYLWVELARPDGWLTIGALLHFSRSANRTQVWYFTTPLRVGADLALLNAQREPLSRKALVELVGEERVTESAEAHRERVRTSVFGLSGDAGRDRYLGLLQLMHTLRSPDVGNRIDEGRLPQIIGDALPPLDELTVSRAGEQLDGLTTTRAALARLEHSHDSVRRLLGVYRRYAASTILDTADATLHSVQDLDVARLTQTQRRDTHDRLRAALAQRTAEEQQFRNDVAELQNAINGIRGRAIFKQADDLVQRDRAVEAFALTTDQALEEAERERARHAHAVRGADRRLEEVREAATAAATALTAAGRALTAAELPSTGLPGQIRVADEHVAAQTSVIRRRRDQSPLTVERPVPALATIWPGDPLAAVPGLVSAIDAARRRSELAQLRLFDARRLAAEEIAVREVEADANRAREQSEVDEEKAKADAGRRDDSAVELAVDWRAWSVDPATADLLGAVDFSTDEVLAPLLLDVEALTGEASTSVDGSAILDGTASLDIYDATPDRLARPARARAAEARAEVAAAQRADDATRADLQAEAAALRRAEDPPPPRAPWHTDLEAPTPFWRLVDFAENLPAAARAGIEGALLAAGVLTAQIEPDGSLRAADGTALLSPASTRAVRPLSAALRPDPAGSAPPGLVLSVLSGIGLDDDSPTSVSADGSWRNGPLRGRHVVGAARHIGAAARAQARQDRLADIDAALAGLDVADADRVRALDSLDDLDRRLSVHLAAAPRTATLYAARVVAAESATRATNSRSTATAATAIAQQARTRWAREGDTHRATCAHHGLPSDIGPLELVTAASADAVRHTTTLVETVRHLVTRTERHDEALVEVAEAATRRAEAEDRADEQWRKWHDLAAEVAALHEAIALDVEQARKELARSERAHQQAQATLQRARDDLATLAPQVGQAEAESRQATTEVGARVEDMIAAARRFTHRVTLPGLATAAADAALVPIDRPEDEASVRTAVEATILLVTKPAQPATANSVFTAFQVFDRDVSGQLDAAHQLDDGVALISVVGAGDDHSLAGVDAVLETRVVQGRVALTDREREVFTTFVLGGVAEELRRRINQAAALIAAMNGSLQSIRTRNGIGVRLSWRLADDAAGLRRIAQLVATADAVRTAEQSDDLVNLLRRRVEEFYAGDPSSGYAAHLAAALDYRRWHEVDVTILGPDPGQERRISKRAKLSQGETRFVSYVTLFAAADAYLTGLSSTGSQLRLILLDDAFAKVDDPTIGELMGLLVHLDLDFVMTGHALWGCFPEVPALDVYEVRRQEGTSAVTTHVHWDGRTRHLRSTA